MITKNEIVEAITKFVKKMHSHETVYNVKQPYRIIIQIANVLRLYNKMIRDRVNCYLFSKLIEFVLFANFELSPILRYTRRNPGHKWQNIKRNREDETKLRCISTGVQLFLIHFFTILISKLTARRCIWPNDLGFLTWRIEYISIDGKPIKQMACIGCKPHLILLFL